MKIGTLKKLIQGIPDNVEVCISDMADFTSDFEVSTYHDYTQTYLELIMPKYIQGYVSDGSEEPVTLF